VIPLVLTVKEVAEVLRCSPDSVYRLLTFDLEPEPGKIPAFRIGAGRKGARVARSALEAFIRSTEAAP